jgi:DNA topoisomerase I
MKRLVVVESPTKARTIRNFLPAEYRVEASMGHVRDLPSSASEIPDTLRDTEWARLGVNVDKDYQPLYVVPPDKKKIVRELKAALKDADELYIATDEDREGESIGWHLVEVLEPRVPVKRMVFHEITREAIEQALRKTRQINTHLVEAQETRRVLDRLVGYAISPLLWRKIAPRLSAGRVQSVAVRLVVLREKERIAFIPANYWGMKARVARKDAAFEATMTHRGGLKIATGKDFADETGRLKEGLTDGRNVLILGEREARELADRLPDMPWRVASVEERTITRSPAPPFITSTLQQEASRKLNLSARQAMQVAQRLYEQGYITYMRTDSTNLSQEALEASRRSVESRYGRDYVSPQPRRYAGKVRNAQEAHEAIRPAGTQMKTAEELRLSGVEGALYDLIWKRTVASQMADARLRSVAANLIAGDGEHAVTFRATGRTIEFPGFFRAYVEGSDDPEGALEDRDQPLPPLAEGESLNCRDVEATGHETRPPARYTEASLVKVLEKEGIGRPSTYASIIDTIVDRGYVRRQSNQLVPSFTAFAANNLMERQFEKLVDIGFTADMEQNLDDIASGDKEALPFLEAFYRGTDGIANRVTTGLDLLDPREISSFSFPRWGPFTIRVGRYGPYVEGEVDGARVTTSLPDDLAPGDVTEEKLRELVLVGSEEDRVLGVHPTLDQPILLKKGPYGPYVQLGDDEQKGKPKRISLPKGVEAHDVDLATASALLDLPRSLGNHPDSGKEVKASIGRFGPYVQHGSTFASLKPTDEVLEIDLDRALELLSEKQAKNEPLRALGNHPETGEPIEILKGRYGPYVKHQKTNASVPKGTEVNDLTLNEALELLAAREKTKGGAGTKGKSPRTTKTEGATPKKKSTASKKATGKKK